MSHENSQFDISGIQLRESKTQPKVSLSREIGEAQITHTIFGKAKVRIIRKGDQARRTMTVVAIAVAAVAVAAWQGWFIPQQIEPAQNAAPSPALSAEPQAGLPASQREIVVAPVAPVEPSMSSESGITSLAASQKTAPQQADNLKEAGQKTTTPAKAHPKQVPIKPKVDSTDTQMAQQTAPAAANKDALKAQTEMPPVRVLPARRYVAPALPVVQPAASSPAAVVPPPKDEVTIQSPVGDKQLSDPINTPGK